MWVAILEEYVITRLLEPKGFLERQSLAPFQTRVIKLKVRG